MRQRILFLVLCLTVLGFIVYQNYQAKQAKINNYVTRIYRGHAAVNASTNSMESNLIELNQKYPGEELVISGISIFSSKDDVLKTFGEPVKKTQTVMPSLHQPDTLLVYIDTWEYDKIELVFFTVAGKSKPVPKEPKGLICIKTTDERYSTTRGVKVGDSVEKVIEKYGFIGITETEKDYYIYRVDTEKNEYIDFNISNGKVCEIQYHCELD